MKVLCLEGRHEKSLKRPTHSALWFATSLGETLRSHRESKIRDSKTTTTLQHVLFFFLVGGRYKLSYCSTLGFIHHIKVILRFYKNDIGVDDVCVCLWRAAMLISIMREELEFKALP